MKNIEQHQRLPELQACIVSSAGTVDLVQVDRPHKAMKAHETRNDVNDQVRTEYEPDQAE